MTALVGELDMDTKAQVLSAVGRCLDTGTRAIIVDLSSLTFCDVSGLNALLAAGRSTSAAGGSLRVVNPSRSVARLISLTGTGGVLLACRGSPGEPPHGSAPGSPGTGQLVISDGMAQVLRLLQLDDGYDTAAQVATRAAETLGVDGLTVSLATGGERAELMWCTDQAAGRFEDLQFTLGEGPGPEAVRTGAMVLVPDLTRIRPERWPALSIEATGLDARAVFCFPMGIGAIRVGVLTVVRRTAGPLTDGQVRDAQVLAHALTGRALGSVVPDPNGPAVPADTPDSLLQAVVHQATGMVSVQLAISLPQALLRLRAHAYSNGRPLTEISRDVVTRRLRLDHNGNDSGNGTPLPVPDKD
ncbi:STAS domain-containing protein [Kitasatospora sp. NPDC056076]|uniref:STAS domain-containing protein n=1 Tax=Kitasatospora sp. NPDC056076 TaxID=3345703 RepID=UPI0035DCE367